jgi:hypothetical protein
MKKLIFTIVVSIASLVSFAQTDSVKANAIIKSIADLDSKKMASYLLKSTNLAVNDCKKEMYDFTPTPVEQGENTAIAKKVINIITNEIGNNFTVTWADCFSVSDFWEDTPIAIVFILTKSDGTRMKINLFCTPEFNIRDVTIYLDSCNHF